MFTACLIPIPGHRVPPLDFLQAVLAYCQNQPGSLFAQNAAPGDLYAQLRIPLLGDRSQPLLGAPAWPSEPGLTVRRAAMAEAMRTHAAFESDYDWGAGVDTTNRYSLAHITGQETGIFQVSFDSEWLDPGLRDFNAAEQIDTPQAFIDRMKRDRDIALDYYARLQRVTTRWAGPWNRGQVQRAVSRPAFAEWQTLLAPAAEPPARPYFPEAAGT